MTKTESGVNGDILISGWTILLTTVISLMVRGRMRARKTAACFVWEQVPEERLINHQLQAGYSLQMMSFGHVWAIDVTILCFSNDAHVGHQLRISLLLASSFSRSASILLCCRFGSCHFFLVLTLPSFSLSSLSPSRLFALDAMQASWDLIRTRLTRCRNCPKGLRTWGAVMPVERVEFFSNKTWIYHLSTTVIALSVKADREREATVRYSHKLRCAPQQAQTSSLQRRRINRELSRPLLSQMNLLK